MNAEFIDAELSKLAPVAGQVIVLQCPPDAAHDDAIALIHQVKAVIPDGVFVACIDHRYRLFVTNVPEVVAMLERPIVTH